MANSIASESMHHKGLTNLSEANQGILQPETGSGIYKYNNQTMRNGTKMEVFNLPPFALSTKSQSIMEDSLSGT